MCMTIIAGIFVLSFDSKKSFLFYVFLSIVLSVIIYYLNYFSKALGETSRLDIIEAIRMVTNNNTNNFLFYRIN